MLFFSVLGNIWNFFKDWYCFCYHASSMDLGMAVPVYQCVGKLLSPD